MMHVDFLTYLPDDILVKVDRACMSASLEGRVPILDHRLVEFMAPLPQQYKLDSTGSKRILRDIVYSRVPRELLDRPKTGFGVPIDSWLRGPLREWAEALLDERVLREQGHFDAAKVRAAWSQHLSGHRLRHHEIWSVLMFQAWRAASLAR
jgi:asparagine synthase (glutamine-hydrolysing)